jgi:hypothetical protein
METFITVEEKEKHRKTDKNTDHEGRSGIPNINT